MFSKGIERKEFPGPLLNDVFYHVQTDAECKPHHRPFALHHLVRERNPRVSEMEEHFRQLHRQEKIPSATSRSLYKDTIKETELQILHEGADIILCTCNEVSSHRMMRSVTPAYSIVDECAMATEPECMIPIRQAQSVVLIGDHQQLQPVINYREAKEMGLGKSLFERYENKLKRHGLKDRIHVLKVQYRMVSMHACMCADRAPCRTYYLCILYMYTYRTIVAYNYITLL